MSNVKITGLWAWLFLAVFIALVVYAYHDVDVNHLKGMLEVRVTDMTLEHAALLIILFKMLNRG